MEVNPELLHIAAAQIDAIRRDLKRAADEAFDEIEECSAGWIRSSRSALSVELLTWQNRVESVLSELDRISDGLSVSASAFTEVDTMNSNRHAGR